MVESDNQMPPLQNLLNQTHFITKRIKSPLVLGMNRINQFNKTNLEALDKITNQNQKLRKSINQTVQQINASGIKSSNLMQTLNRSTISIQPLTWTAADVKVTILKSMAYQRLPKDYMLEIQKLAPRHDAYTLVKLNRGLLYFC